MVPVGQSVRHIAVFLVAACLAGCGSYTMFDPSASAFTSSGKQAAFTKTSSETSASDPDATGSTGDTTALNSLFARASQGKLSDDAVTSPPAAPAPAIKPIALADAGDTAVPAPQTAAPITQPRGRAYLFRGIAGLIYSRGMDKLAERIKRAGIDSSVDTYLVWRGVADQAIRDYRRDPQPIILIGHSMGGDATLAFAEMLNAADIPV